MVSTCFTILCYISLSGYDVFVSGDASAWIGTESWLRYISISLGLHDGASLGDGDTISSSWIHDTNAAIPYFLGSPVYRCIGYYSVELRFDVTCCGSYACSFR